MALPEQSFPALAKAGEVSDAGDVGGDGRGEWPGPVPEVRRRGTRLVTSDLHLFSSKLARDLVVRFAPGQPIQEPVVDPRGRGTCL